MNRIRARTIKPRFRDITDFLLKQQPHSFPAEFCQSLGSGERKPDANYPCNYFRTNQSRMGTTEQKERSVHITSVSGKFDAKFKRRPMPGDGTQRLLAGQCSWTTTTWCSQAARSRSSVSAGRSVVASRRWRVHWVLEWWSARDHTRAVQWPMTRLTTTNCSQQRSPPTHTHAHTHRLRHVVQLRLILALVVRVLYTRLAVDVRESWNKLWCEAEQTLPPAAT